MGIKQLFKVANTILRLNKEKPFLDINPRNWSYYPYGCELNRLGLNITEESLYEFPICHIRLSVLAHAHWIKDKMVCKGCAEANQNMSKVVDTL